MPAQPQPYFLGFCARHRYDFVLAAFECAAILPEVVFFGARAVADVDGRLFEDGFVYRFSIFCWCGRRSKRLNRWLFLPACRDAIAQQQKPQAK